MPQLPLFGEVLQQPSPVARSIARPSQPRSPRSKSARQQPLLPISAATAPAIATSPAPIAPEIDRLLPPAPLPAKKLPPGWVDPKDPAFNYLKNCRLCGAPIKTGGLDHSLCSGYCGWVADLIWQERQQRLKRSRQSEPQAPTHTIEANDFATLDLFSYGLEGGEA